MSMSKAEWYELKIAEIEAKFGVLFERVKKAEEEIQTHNKRLDNHEGIGDFCPHTGK